MMQSFWPIYKREIFVFFVTPLAWVLAAVFMIVQGMHFVVIVQYFLGIHDAGADQTPVQAFFGSTVLLYLIMFLLVPAMTMRLLAEERRTGTLETLLTAPTSYSAVVLAKYASVLTTYVAMWIPTVLYMVILGRNIDIDWQVVGAAYLGIACVGAGYLAVGVLMSAITDSQFVALVLTALVMVGLFVLGVGEFTAREGSWVQAFCSHVSVWAHMSHFASGIVDLRAIVFYASLVVTSLFASVRVLEAQRWGG